MIGDALKDRILAIFPYVLFLMLCLYLTVPGQTVKEGIQEALDAGDTNKAIELLTGAIESDPSYHIHYYLLGKIYYNLAQYADARVQFEAALDKKSKHYESIYYMGRTLLNLGEVDEADELMSNGLKKAKKLKAWFENGIGLVAMAREQYDEADRAFRRAIAENESIEQKELKDLREAPCTEEERQQLMSSLQMKYALENAEYRINLGDANFYQGVAPLAIIEYEKALELDTGSTEVFFHWAEACLELKDYNCAIEKLGIVLSKDSTFAQAWNRAAGIYYKAGRSSRDRQERKARFFDAIGAYRKYLDLTNAEVDSTTVRVYFEMAMAYIDVRAYDSAAVDFEKVLSIPYEPKDIYFYFGKSLWGIRDYARAADMLLKHQEWVTQQGDEYHSKIREAEFNQLLGDAYFYRKPKDFPNAIKYYKISLEHRPDQKRLLENVAVAYHSMKSYNQAIEYYDRRIEQGIVSTSIKILKNAGLCALNLASNAGDEEELDLEEFEDEEETEVPTATDPDINYFEAAINYMNQYLEYKSDDTTVILRVANTYLYQLADCANGVKYFERLLALDPGNCLAKKSLGYAYFGGICDKNYSKALRYLRDAYSCISAEDGACADVALVKWIAQCYHLRAVDKTGDPNSDFKNAFEWYSKVLKCDPTDSEAKKGQDDTRFEFN